MDAPGYMSPDGTGFGDSKTGRHEVQIWANMLDTEMHSLYLAMDVHAMKVQLEYAPDTTMNPDHDCKITTSVNQAKEREPVDLVRSGSNQLRVRIGC
ncbi:hypothetical protein PAAG_12025 [Paracoccidioides lutzii Pb01]|uniref:Uncharacterized protein n=1 Tax=Paracoccidioides lutzii (strain ATCC MYA-826 / Pb01) TaxID=502779 RepID=A0A0A2VK43_PARBA|nr:hypothetical protein PAAG_12025 [Paracoccidioides lutzii Pb01]KGQ01254.1 hypothetical protein PAAG_12025 [Paracoccidioides lutzii Pb01]